MNQLKVNRQHSIVSLFEQGWSKRRIARELALDRATVRKYLARVTPNSPTPQTGSAESTEANSPTPQTGSVANAGPASVCDRWREQIASAFEPFRLSAVLLFVFEVCLFLNVNGEYPS